MQGTRVIERAGREHGCLAGLLRELGGCRKGPAERTLLTTGDLLRTLLLLLVVVMMRVTALIEVLLLL